MSSELYFFDQHSHASHIGGFYRSKRDFKDFDQAFYHVKVALSLDNDQPDGRGGENNISLSSIKQTNDISSESTLLTEGKMIVPEILTKELDIVLQKFNDESKVISPLSDQSKSPIEDNEEFISNLPKVSLPAQLIIQLHSTWFDLIKNTNYKHKVEEQFLIDIIQISNSISKKKRFGVQKQVKMPGVIMFDKNVPNN
jgi:hypothetical protein